VSGVDHVLLDRHRRFSDPAAGWTEEFLVPAIGGARTVAVLTRPSGLPRSVGWVICHSFGLEQLNLDRCEVLTARALARSGSTVLRFHVQGYGDSERRWDPPTLAGHLAGAEDAVALLASEGVDRIGTFGIRLGGTVATLVADRLDLPLLAAWEPFSDGSTYLRDFRRLHTLSALTGGSAGDLPDPSPLGWTDVAGFVLTDQTRREIEAIDLARDVGSFRGEALIGAASRGGSGGPRAAAVTRHLQALGASCATEVIRDPTGPLLGQFHFKTRADDPHVEVDSQLELFKRLAESTAGWAAGRSKG
jgi:pimeloyl-ACP methyl ester carboxylesterase